MKNWFMSLDGAVALSVLALLTFVARITGLDAMFVLPNEMGVREDQVVTVALFMLGIMGLLGGWIWALLAAARGGRGGLILTLIFNIFTVLFGGLFTLVVFCQPGCAAPPVGALIVWAELLAGLSSSAAVWLQLGRARQGIV